MYNSPTHVFFLLSIRKISLQVLQTKWNKLFAVFF